jgi:hypothetical protein
MVIAASLTIGLTAGRLHSQTAPAPAATGQAPLNWTTQQDRKNMMEQLGIARLRPGSSGRADATNAANYDPGKANPFPNLPEPLHLKNGRKVTTPETWWKERRPEIVAGAWDFERINRRYARHLKVLAERPGGALRNDTAAKALLRWAAAESRACGMAGRGDPAPAGLLPGRILPSDYPGQQAWRRRVEVLRDAGRQLPVPP